MMCLYGASVPPGCGRAGARLVDDEDVGVASAAAAAAAATDTIAVASCVRFHPTVSQADT